MLFPPPHAHPPPDQAGYLDAEHATLLAAALDCTDALITATAVVVGSTSPWGWDLPILVSLFLSSEDRDRLDRDVTVLAKCAWAGSLEPGSGVLNCGDGGASSLFTQASLSQLPVVVRTLACHCHTVPF